MASRIVVGLDLGSSGVKAAQVRRFDDGHFEVEKQGAVRLPRGAVVDGSVKSSERVRVSEAIRELWEKAKFDTKDVIVGFNSSSRVFMQEMLVPIMPPGDVAKSLPQIMEVANSSINAEEYVFSYTVVGEELTTKGPKLRILIYSVRAAYAEELAGVVMDAGLNYVGGDLNALAALRAVSILDRAPRQVDALVDIGSQIMILMLHHNGVPKMIAWDADSASEVLTERIAAELGLEPDDARAEFAKVDDQQNLGPVSMVRSEYADGLSKKIASGFQSYLDKSDDFDSIANVALVGGGALLNELNGALRRAFGTVSVDYAYLDESIMTPDGAEPNRHADATGGDYLIAIGLGTGAVG